MPIEKVRIEAPPGIPSQIVSAYIEKCRASVPALRAALEGSEFESLKVSGHRLRGTGGAYGVPVLTTIGASIEQAALHCNASELRNQVATLEAYLGRIEVVTG